MSASSRRTPSTSAAPAGNPFMIGRDGSRDEVIAKYRAWIVRQPALMAALHELRDKNLVCPERCDADVLIELATSEPTGAHHESLRHARAPRFAGQLLPDLLHRWKVKALDPDRSILRERNLKQFV
jgi:hypothetical protein